MERTATADGAASSASSGVPPAAEEGGAAPHAPGEGAGRAAGAGAHAGAALDAGPGFAEVAQLLDGMPRQRGRAPGAAADGAVVTATLPETEATGRTAPVTSAARLDGRRGPGGFGGARRALRPWRLLPDPTGTPFTFGYAVVLAVTSLVARCVDPALMNVLYQGSSTDVAHLVRTPLLVLTGSALWVAGGIASPYALCFLLVLTALERRVGGLRTAGVFLFGHVLATLATEVPVGLAVLGGLLPDSSLHRLDYGISFGVAAGVGALSGLLAPWLRWPLLLGFLGMQVPDLMAYTDPMTSSGHLISVSLGAASWPVVRRWARARVQSPAAVTA
ncbi:rhomboid-like protein [Streptomyces sp. NPDC096152]|uniref:rhomboid-like protein n=1 Tax=Streptomyces sp. NPDC096152 TaxID=3366078 RepID=UPI0037F175F7